MALNFLSFKVCMLGAQGVGKSCIVSQITSDTFRYTVPPTVGASFATITLKVDNISVRLQIWDTAGQERFKSMIPMYYRKAQLAIIVFDITCTETYKEIISWAEELKENMKEEFILCIIGNKSDMNTKRKVDRKKAYNFASSIGAMYFETSAKTNDGIRNAFVQMARRLIKFNQLCEEQSHFCSKSITSINKTVTLDRDNSQEKTSSCCF